MQHLLLHWRFINFYLNYLLPVIYIMFMCGISCVRKSNSSAINKLFYKSVISYCLCTLLRCLCYFYLLSSGSFTFMKKFSWNEVWVDYVFLTPKNFKKWQNKTLLISKPFPKLEATIALQTFQLLMLFCVVLFDTISSLKTSCVEVIKSWKFWKNIMFIR